MRKKKISAAKPSAIELMTDEEFKNMPPAKEMRFAKRSESYQEWKKTAHPKEEYPGDDR